MEFSTMVRYLTSCALLISVTPTCPIPLLPQILPFTSTFGMDLVDSKSLFFVEKSYINNKFLEVKIRLSSVEKKDFLRFLHGDGDKVTCGSGVEVTNENLVTQSRHFWCGSDVEVGF